MNLSRHHVAKIFFVIAAMLPSLSAQTLKLTTPIVVDGAFVTKRGALVQGQVEGNLVALDETASVTLEKGASLTGDLLVSAGKPTPETEAFDPARKPSPFSQITIDNRGGGDSVKGEVRAAAGFDLPRILVPSTRVKTEAVEIQGAIGAPADFSQVGSITVRKPGVSVFIPPGSYGDLTVVQGTVVLGVLGETEPVRYEFRTFDVQARGSVDVAGPVTITVADGSSIHGRVGNADAPLWLDLRIATGDVLVAGQGALYAFLSAPLSKITVSRGASLTGGVASDQLEVAAGATAKAIAPDWSDSATGKTRPRFPHKALRLESKVPELKAGFRHSFYPGTSYIDDIPYVMLSEGKRPREHPLAAYEEQRALFEACCTLFVDTDFERGVLTLAGYSDDPIARPATVRNLVLTRQHFVTRLEAVAGKGTEADNIRAIVRNPGLLEKFQAETLALHAVSNGKR